MTQISTEPIDSLSGTGLRVHSELVWAWGMRAVFLVAGAIALTAASKNFEAIDVDLGDGRSLLMAAGMVAACLAFVIDIPRLIRRSQSAMETAHAANLLSRLVMVIVLGGLAARLMMFASEPILEDDYFRYLWDGAVSAHGLNPYAISPNDALALSDPALDVTKPPLAPDSGSTATLMQLATNGGHVLDRVNHPLLKTIYPPVAQAAFTLAHVLAPWSLTSWRAVCLFGDLATMLLVFSLLRVCHRSPLWVALYWWNPLAIVTLFNSVHMEAVLMPLVLLALLLSAHRRHISASAALGLAIGVKVWPILLAPLLLKPLLTERKKLLTSVAVLVGLVALFAYPVVVGGLDASSGFVAYAAVWQTNSALFPFAERLVQIVIDAIGANNMAAGSVARAIFATLLGCVALIMAVGRVSPVDIETTDHVVALDLLWRASFICTAMVLLSPAQFPWYLAWVMPLLAVVHVRAMLAAVVTVPIYYASFHFHFNDNYDTYKHAYVWLIWLPVWALLAVDAWRWWLEGRSPIAASEDGVTATRAAGEG